MTADLGILVGASGLLAIAIYFLRAHLDARRQRRAAAVDDSQGAAFPRAWATSRFLGVGQFDPIDISDIPEGGALPDQWSGDRHGDW